MAAFAKISLTGPTAKAAEVIQAHLKTMGQTGSLAGALRYAAIRVAKQIEAGESGKGSGLSLS